MVCLDFIVRWIYLRKLIYFILNNYVGIQKLLKNDVTRLTFGNQCNVHKRRKNLLPARHRAKERTICDKYRHGILSVLPDMIVCLL